jgi:hypothetical protein
METDVLEVIKNKKKTPTIICPNTCLFTHQRWKSQIIKLIRNLWKASMEKTMGINELCFKNFYVWPWPHNKVAFVNGCLHVSSYAWTTFHSIKLLIDGHRVSEWISLLQYSCKWKKTTKFSPNGGMYQNLMHALWFLQFSCILLRVVIWNLKLKAHNELLVIVICL